MREAVCVLVSGGFDSNVLVAELLRRHEKVYPLYVRCGFVWEKAELYWLKKYLRRLGRRPPPTADPPLAEISPRTSPPRSSLQSLTLLSPAVAGLESPKWVRGLGTPGYRSAARAVYLPGRNLLLLTQAALFCAQRKIGKIALGTLRGNPFPDARPSFFRRFEAAASLALNHPIKILTPFAKRHKRDLLRFARGLPLHLSFSCLAPQGIAPKEKDRRPCGRCNKCAERDKLTRAVDTG